MLVIKNLGTKDKTYKVKFVVQVYTEAERNMLVHASTYICQQSILMLIAMSGRQKFLDIESGVRTSRRPGFIGSVSSKRTRDVQYVIVKAKDAIKLRSNELLKLLKLLYRLLKSSNYWHVTISSHLEQDLRRESTNK